MFKSYFQISLHAISIIMTRLEAIKTLIKNYPGQKVALFYCFLQLTSDSVPVDFAVLYIQSKGRHIKELIIISQPIARPHAGYGPSYDGSVQLKKLNAIITCDRRYTISNTKHKS